MVILVNPCGPEYPSPRKCDPAGDAGMSLCSMKHIGFTLPFLALAGFILRINALVEDTRAESVKGIESPTDSFSSSPISLSGLDL